ncbi:MAG: protein O-mannosyl-transferase family, partial [Planctomycetota bacterium]
MNFLRNRPIEAGFIILLLAVYIFFSAPGLTWGDGVYIALALEEVGAPPEYTGGHPVYRAAARAFSMVLPFGDLMRRLNIFSSVAATVAIALFLILLNRAGLNRAAVLAGGIILAFSHLFWFHAEVTEVYALFACLFFGSLVLFLRYLSDRSERNLQLLLFILGLSAGCHPFILLAYPGIVAAIWRNRPAENLGGKGIVRCVLVFALGFSPVIYVFALGAAAAGIKQGILNAFFLGRSSLAGKVFGLDMFTNPGLVGKNLLLFSLAWLYQFAGLAVVLIIIGAGRLWQKHRELAVFSLITSITNFLFAVNYNVSDQLVFYTPIFIFSAIAASFGVERILKLFSGKKPATVILLMLLVLAPVTVYNVAPAVYRGLGTNLAGFHIKPYRDPVEYFLVPTKRNFNDVEKYVTELHSELPVGAVIFLDSPDYLFLQYSQHVRKIRQDIKVRHFSIS